MMSDDAGLNDEDEDMRQLVCCLVDDQEYAFALEDTQEIVRIPESITKVPKAGMSTLGIMNLRSKTLPLVSLRSMFGLPQIDFDDTHRVLVVNIRMDSNSTLPIGIVVDGVREVLRVHKNQLDAVPSLMSRMGQSKDITAICNLDNGERTLSVVDVNHLFNSEMYEQLNASSSGEEENDDMESALVYDDETDMQLVIFKLDKEEFGISINAVQEIIRIPDDISKVPKTDGFIQGVINLRGNVLPIVDLRRRFSLPDMPRHDRQRILVVHFDKISTGFIVDSVSEVLRIPESQLEEAPALSEEQAQLMSQVVNFDKRMIGVLTADQLLSNTEMYKVYMAAHEADE
jgi:purine-binding chemotaxis protein CheW